MRPEVLSQFTIDTRLVNWCVRLLPSGTVFKGSETLEFTTIQAGVIAELWADAPTDVRAFFKTAGKRKKDWEDAQHYLIENKVEV